MDNFGPYGCLIIMDQHNIKKLDVMPMKVNKWCHGPFTSADGTTVLTELLDSSGWK